MPERAKIDRAITAAEIGVIRAALQRAATAPGLPALIEELAHLRAIDRCQCGCDSVDFAKQDPEHRSRPIADAIGETPSGGTVGLIVWGTSASVTGIEVYDLGAGEDDLRLPIPSSVRPLHHGAA